MEEILYAYVKDVVQFNQGDMDAIAHKAVYSEISEDGFWVKFGVSFTYPCAREVIDILAKRHPNLSRKYSEGSEVFNDTRLAGKETIGLREIQGEGLPDNQRLGLGEEE